MVLLFSCDDDDDDSLQLYSVNIKKAHLGTWIIVEILPNLKSYLSVKSEISKFESKSILAPCGTEIMCKQ